MNAKTSRVLVIDASIARAAGDTSEHPTSRECRELLGSVLKICHRMILTPEIREEWNRHQSRFARTWRVSMMARKKVVLTTTPRDAALRAQLIRHAADEPSRAAMLKDCCLVEGALAGDGAVISLDERVRTLFRAIAPQVRQIAPIIWVNPTLAAEEAEAWLLDGAKPEARRRLDHTV